MTDEERGSRRGVFRLIGDLPSQLIALVKAELDSLKKEIIGKLVAAGIGIGLLVGAALFAFFLLAVLITAAILGIATALPAWLSALIVAAALLIVTIVLALLGLKKLKQGVPPAPTETITSLKKDVNVIKGIGKRD
jgi:Putative Actinobacterial Holin-X, holin superfamily III